MAVRDLRDSGGQLKARIIDAGDQEVLYDAGGRKLGFYDRKTDTTYTGGGIKVGAGNQLSGLI